MESLIIIIAMFIIVVFIVRIFSKGQQSEAMANINMRIKANTAEVLLDFNAKAEELGMTKEKMQHAKDLLDIV